MLRHMKKMKARKALGAVVFQILVIGLGIIMLYPVAWLILTSFKPSNQIFVNSARLIPETFILDNYVNGWKGFGGTDFSVFFKNSFIITILTVIGQVSASTIVAYGFARIRFRGKAFWFACMVATMLLPAQVLMIPQYIMFKNFNWLNSFAPLVVPAFTGLPFFIFLIIQFIRGIPRTLDESAYIDGSGKLTTFFRIIVPLASPAIITSAIFSFYWKWDEFMGPLLYLQNPKLYTVSLALKSFSDPSASTDWGALFAMLVASLIPSFLIFIFFQKHLVEGIATTGMKN